MPGRLDGVTILIVDDDKDIRESFEAALQAEGASTRTVEDGNAAVAVCQGGGGGGGGGEEGGEGGEGGEDGCPDIVLLDMMLPKRSGFLVLERIKGYQDAPLVIMVTANEGKRHQAYAESLGVDAYLLKPVPLTHLIDTCVRLLEQEAAEDDAAQAGA